MGHWGSLLGPGEGFALTERERETHAEIAPGLHHFLLALIVSVEEKIIEPVQKSITDFLHYGKGLGPW